MSKQMTPWTVVIPSYNRVETLKEKTLALLQKHNIPKERIHVVVADEEQAKLYKAGVGESVGKIVVGVKGLVPVRNWIFKHYPLGTPLISFDDDVRGFIEYDPKAKRHERPLRDVAAMFDRGFDECNKVKARFWGVYPSANGFFMKPGVTTDLRFIIGSFWGCLNPGEDIQVPIGGGEKEDYQRTILFWEADGVIVRLRDVAVQTSTYGTPGGLQDGNRLARERKTVKAMLKRWPDFLAPNPRRKSGYPEVRLVQPKKTRKVARK